MNHIIKHHKWNSFVLLLSLLLLGAAFWHFQLLGLEHKALLNIAQSPTNTNLERYRQSLLGGLELIGIVVILACNLVNLIVLIVQLVKKRWTAALTTFCIIIVSMLLWSLSLWIDSPTLVFIT